ncbi:MAG: thiamine pyrophosphate-binding protein [Pseudomonadota bacterium]
MAARTGAESLVETFLAEGVNLCFANPGTSEMHFVAALDSHPDMRCVLCLFEGGASGAADGYFRMSGKVAATMFHLAPGFGNAFANLHNARKAGSGIVNVMGEHARITLPMTVRSRAIPQGSATRFPIGLGQSRMRPRSPRTALKPWQQRGVGMAALRR